LLEGGIGSGGNLLAFQKLGYDVAGLDILPEAVEHARQRGLSDVWQQSLEEPWPVEPQSLRAVVLLDVLEHLADPVAALRQARESLRDDGAIVFTVPAYEWLYGTWDKTLGHYRRYTTRELRRQAREAQLQVAWVSHWNAFTLPAAVVVRGWSRLFPREAPAEFPRVSPAMNGALKMAAAVERRWLTKVNVPAGLSLVGVLTR
jgi:SAM-dependent methyltransferase